MQTITKEEKLQILEQNNYKLARFLEEQHITKLNLIGCGNSITSGYSLSSFTKPLLLRNESIQRIMEEEGINLSRYHFSRAEDNNDEHTYSYFINNIPLSTIHQLNRFDNKEMHATGIIEEDMETYYSLTENTTLNQILLDDKKETANIIIYNGATGSFLDNITRKGKLSRCFTYGIKRDCVSIEAIMKYIQELNRMQQTNIQVYLCAAPKVLGLSDIFINPKLKEIASNYANVTYVPNINRSLLYKSEEGKPILDVHYNELEYLELNNKIMESILQNYLKKQIFIEIDRELYLINTLYQARELTNKQILSILFNDIGKKYNKILQQEKIDIKQLQQEIKKYLLERSPYDFYYIGKNNIKQLSKKLEPTTK